MKTTMTAKVSVRRISTHARVHRTTDRPDLQAPCAAAHDAPGDRGGQQNREESVAR